MKQKKTPLRMCVSCRKMKQKKELIRVVRTPDGEFVIDTAGKRAGRGAYICGDPECVELAKKQRKLERNFESGGCAVLYEPLLELARGLKNI
jgi:predicted RNA-binding protein YlxR (DUF448 family)